MKKSLLTFVLALLMAAPLSAFNANVAQAGAPLSANTAIRGESAVTVYWYANDGKRYVFPNAAAYFTWFPSWDTVRTITDADLISIPLGGNATYRPGAKLVKINTDPRTYAVAKGGVLRHVTSESLASQLYGADWRSDVHDIPDVYFTNYTVGTPIYNASDYNVSNEYNGVFTPSDSLRITNGGTQTGDLVLNASRTSINPGEAVTLTVGNMPAYTAGDTVEIFDARDNGLLCTTAWPNMICNSFTVHPQRKSTENSLQYYVVFTDSTTLISKRGYSPVVYFGSSPTGTLTLTADRTNISSGQPVTLNANYNNSLNAERIVIREVRTNTIVKTCYGTTYCTVTVYPYQNGYPSTQYSASVVVSANSLVTTQYSPVITFVGTTSGQNTLTASLNKTTIYSGETVTVTAHASNLNEPLHRIKIELYTYWTYHLIDTCYGSATCSFQTHASKWEDGHDAFFVRLVTTDGSELARTDLPSFVFLNQTGSGDNRINGLVLNADRTNINASERVRLTANAFNAGTWSYTGNHIEIWNDHTNQLLRTCYDVSTCVMDVYPQARSSTNLTAQYQALIYDRNGVRVMSQYSPVIYLTSYNGSNGNSTIGTGTITFAPTDALHPNRNVYLTSTFTGSNVPQYDAQVRIYTEQSSMPIAICNGGYTCAVSYPTGSSPMTTRIYGQLSNRFSVGTYAETPRVNLTTTW